jgi:hypothetical protein
MQEEQDRIKFKAEEARKVLDNPLIKAFFKDLEEYLRNSMWKCKENDIETFNALKGQANMLSLFKTSFETYITTGKLVAQQESVDESNL